MTVVREAVPGDRPRLDEIDAATHSTTSSPGPGPVPGSARPERDLAGVLVAEVDGVVQGAIVLAAATPLASNAHVRLVGGLDVHPDAQGLGLGRALLRAGMDHARDQGVTRLRLRVLGHNDRARRLYEAVGFEVEGVLRGEFLLDGQPVDDVLMAISLDADERGSL